MNSDKLYINVVDAKYLIKKIKNIDYNLNINGFIQNNKVKIIGYDNINNYIMCENSHGKMFSVHPFNIVVI